MEPAVSTQLLPTKTEEEQYRRLLDLYQELETELAKLEKEGKILKQEIFQVLDQEKMKEVLQKIIAQP